MPTTRDALELRIRAFFENDNFYQSANIVDSIQDGYDEISSFSGCILKSVQIDYVKDLTYYDMITLIPDFVGVFAIFSHPIKRWLLSSSLRKFNLDRPDWDAAYGVTYYFSQITHRRLAIYKKPSVDNYGKMSVFYIARSATLSSGSSVIQIPDVHLTTLSEYVETDLWEQQQEWTKAGMHLSSYMKNCNELYQYAKNLRSNDRLAGLKGMH